MERCIKPSNFGHVKSAQLHYFCDASEKGYGVFTYLKLINEKNDVHVAFIMGKARVAPLKQMTIPRMELTAAVQAVRMDRMLSTELQISLDKPVCRQQSMSYQRSILFNSVEIHQHKVKSSRSRLSWIKSRCLPEM